LFQQLLTAVDSASLDAGQARAICLGQFGHLDQLLAERLGAITQSLPGDLPQDEDDHDNTQDR
jgi:hypothetical protein